VDNKHRFQEKIEAIKKQIGRLMGTTKNDYFRERLGDIYGSMQDLESEVSYYSRRYEPDVSPQQRVSR